ncbi:MAG: AIR synthase-related protein [Bacteroidota bacterium]
MSIYNKRGVSAHKEEVLAATENLSKGLFPNAFCKIYPDYLGSDEQFINVMHADGAGTKSILAYLYWKETGDIKVWEGIAQDAIVMNLDDLLCVGIFDHIVFNSTIDRNKNLITGEVLDHIINGSQQFFDLLKSYGVNIHYLGGETADVGDVVRTVAVNGTMTCRWPKNRIITNEKIVPGDVIVGLASYGKASYESFYNSGIGSNGLTSARHDALNKSYAVEFKESYDPALSDDVVYIGKNRMTDLYSGTEASYVTVGKMLLSPTRTYAPILIQLLENHFDKIHGLIHCSGGGQTKCMKYMPGNYKVIKDNLFEAPEVFQLIKNNSGSSNRELYEVFNMGCRMEIYCNEADAQSIINVAKSFEVDAQIIGRVEEDVKKSLEIRLKDEVIVY